MHRAPYCAVGVILIEEVIFTIIEYQAIRIIHPVGFGGEMKLRTVLLPVIPGYCSLLDNFFICPLFAG
jgi:hypothetical protein